MISLVIPPAGTVVSLDEAKVQARVEVDQDDVLIQYLIDAATEAAQEFTQRAFLEQEWEYWLPCFPSAKRFIELPRPPLIEVNEVVYLDAQGVEQSLDEYSVYRVLAPTGPRAPKGQIVLNAGMSWPATLAVPDAVKIRFTAGYELVPEPIKQAIKIHVADLYENRENTVLTGAVLQQVPFNVNAILMPYRVGEKFAI